MAGALKYIYLIKIYVLHLIFVFNVQSMANMQRPQIHSNNTLVLEDIGEASHSYEIQIIGNITSSGEILGETEIDLKNISMPIKLEVEENDQT